MLNQKRSGNLARLKYLAALPVCACLLCASTLGFSKTYGLIDLAPQKATDTVKKLKLVEVKPSKSKTKVKEVPNVTLKDTLYGQKKMAIKDVPVSAAVKEITIDPVRKGNNSKNADLKLDDIKQVHIDQKAVKNTDVIIIGPADPVKAKGKVIKSADVKIDAEQPTPVMLKLQKMPPPPMEPIPPVSKDFENLFKSLQKTVMYPASARESNIVGSVIVKFNVNGSHNVSDVVVLQGIGNGCDEEVARAIKAFKGPVEAKAGNYKMAVTFDLDGIKAPKPASGDLFKDPSFAGEIVVVGYRAKK